MVIDEPLGNLLIVVFTGDHTGGPSPWRVGLLKISHVCRDRCYDNLTGGLLAVAENPQQRAVEAFNRPEQLFAEYREWHRSPMGKYAAECLPSLVSISGMTAMHIKMSPMAYIAQAKLKIHPGVAMTVVRTDEILSENILFSSRASTSMFIGTPNVSRREARVDAVTFEVHHLPL